MRTAVPALGCAAIALLAAVPARTAAAPVLSVDYTVRLRTRTPGRAQIRWTLAGIDEIDSFRIVFRDERTSGVTGTGRLTWHGRTLEWTPGSPYAHLRYVVTLDHLRPPGPRFDSHAAADWVAVRARDLFPEINVRFRGRAAGVRSRARLIFDLPHGWRSTSALAPAGRNVYVVEEPGKHFDRPRGWYLLGQIARHRRHIAGADVTVAVAPGSALDARRLFRLYTRTMPLLARILGAPPPRLLVVSAPDPMWHGGLSGEDSFFVHGNLPLRSRDGTSTYLHELFHAWQPFRPGADGLWIAEGLAEYYSLVLQARAGRLSAARFGRAVAALRRTGVWHVDLSRSRRAATLNNSAPFVLAALDHEIAIASGGARGLDDVVRRLAAEPAPLTTARLLQTASEVAGKNLSAFFRRHVYRGEPPGLAPAVTLPSG